MCISSGNETMVGSECEPNHDSRATTRGWRVRAAPQLLRAQLPTHHAPFQTVACIRHVTPNASRSAALSHAHQLPNFPNPNPENVVATRDTTQEHRLLAEKTKAGAQAAARAAFRALTRLDSRSHRSFLFAIAISACFGMWPVEVCFPTAPYLCGGYFSKVRSSCASHRFPIPTSSISSDSPRNFFIGRSPAPQTLDRMQRSAFCDFRVRSYRLSRKRIALVQCLFGRASYGLNLSLTTFSNSSERFLLVSTVRTRAMLFRTILIRFTRPGCPPTC
mmetsp:Transcript_1359/g.3103  ORF Transcript_1359/g.3103 Transcript_1359/m.3103 type:complete len:276 (-) Transcript_1359:464-1291(-)